jgi:hypothetical protein
MPSIINSDDGAISGSSGLETTGGNDGVTVFQQNGVESMRIGATGNITLAMALGVANGGTGQSSLTANNILLGNGTSAVQFVAPGTNGNILTSNGTTWTSAAAPAGVPAGTVIWFAVNSAPTGYLAANGASVSTSTYAALFAVIGYTYGGAGAAFNLPDLRGYFVRGMDNGRGVDSGRTFGSNQADAFQGHFHGWRRFPNLGGGSGNTPLAQAGGTIINTIVTDAVTNGVNGTPRTASETRPTNIALLGCIKF